MYGSSWDKESFYEGLFGFDTICNISQPQELQRYNCACEFIGKSAMLKYHLNFNHQ